MNKITFYVPFMTFFVNLARDHSGDEKLAPQPFEFDTPGVELDFIYKYRC